MKRTRDQKARIGALPPRYAFILNPYGETKFTKCPRCQTRTNLRKFPLVIHVEDCGLVVLGKTCRLCLRCETLIAHKAELDKLLSMRVTGSKPEYFVLGTVDAGMYRRSLTGGTSLDDLRVHTSDFKSYWNVEITPTGWHPKNRPETEALANTGCSRLAKGASG